MCPKVVSIQNGKTSQIQKLVCYMPAQPIKVSQKSVMCKLSSVKVVDAMEPLTSYKVTSNVELLELE